MTISIMISDPEILVREGLKRMLSSCSDFQISLETGDAASTLKAIMRHPLDVCILELGMGRNAGLRFLQKVKEASGSIPLLVMGYQHEREFALRVHRRGGAGYIAKDCTGDQLVHALRTVASRRPYIGETMREMLVENIMATRSNRRHDALSDANYDILCLLGLSLPIARIASMCGLPASTIRSRKTRIMQQLSLRNDADIVHYVMTRKLVAQAY